MATRIARVVGLMIGVALAWHGTAEGQLWGPPKANLWPRWEKHSPADTRPIDHAAWDAFLRKHVDTKHPSGINRVNYKAVGAEERKALDDYVKRLQSVAISGYNRNEQRAYWINLYNAYTVKLILDHYPVTSIRKIKPRFLSLGPWDEKYLTVEGEGLSLNDIEHRILRPIWKDGRVHYAVNCASLGCPNLAGSAYTAENTDRMLNELAAQYVNHPRGASLQDGRLKVSSIYEWFQDDFGGSWKGVLEHLKKHARPELQQKLATFDGAIDHDYDWGLNQP
jgi:hypothetical protein